MKKWIIILICIILVLIGYNIYIRISFNQEREELLDSFNNDSIRAKNDTIVLKRDSIVEKRILLEKDYETETTTINNQSIASDVEFFSNYLSKYDERFVDSNFSYSTKAN